MKPTASLAFVTVLATTTFARTQAHPFTDPANLRDERVKPTDGRELPIDEGARGLEQMLRRLNTRASILNIVAHPDDEDGGMLAFYSRGLGARVADMSLTRGEGGQNAVTGDFEDALGLLRTQELLSSDRYPGIDQFFGTEVDFGFSKTKEEAFGKWTHERVLYDVVRAIRLYRPLVLTSTWIGGVTDGHGHHQVSGQITQEAFNAAGNPQVFPELTREGILPWQPLKVYARVPQQAITPQGLFDYATGQYAPARFTNYVTGAVTTTPPSVDVVVHEGITDPLLSDPGASGPGDSTTTGPRSYVQFARIGLGLQRSQIGPGVRNAPSGAFDVSYHLFGSRLVPKTKEQEDNFFNGIDVSWTGLASLAPNAASALRDQLGKIGTLIASATAAFTPGEPAAVAPVLAQALHSTDDLLASLEKAAVPPEQKANLIHELRIKRVQLNGAIALALGLRLQAEAPVSDALLRTPVNGTAHLSKLADVPVLIRSVGSGTGDSGGSASKSSRAAANALSWTHPNGAAGNVPYSADIPCTLPATQETTRPYFHRDGLELPVYTLSNPALRNAPATPAPFLCSASLTYNGVPLTLTAVATHTGEAVSIVPPVSLSLSAHAQVMPSSEHSAVVTATVAGSPAGAGDTLSVRTTNGWSATPVTGPLQPGSTPFTVTPPASRAVPSTQITVTGQTAGGKYAESVRPVGYSGLPRTNFYTPATDRVVPVDLALPAQLRLAFLPGTGDAVADALQALGVKVTRVSVSDLTPERLAAFDTVLLGVRAYAAHPDLHGAPTQALLDFARNGGNVVLQYQTAEFTGADAPYPLTLGRDAEKVVDEAAGVQLLDGQAPLLATPNRIGTADFGGWIEERGHGFLRTWDPRYTPLTETHDPGQEPQRGGLITTQLGKGRWTYLAFALYRQMPEAVPGSFRLMVNLLAPVTH